MTEKQYQVGATYVSETSETTEYQFQLGGVFVNHTIAVPPVVIQNTILNQAVMTAATI